MQRINIKLIAEELDYSSWDEVRNKINELSDFPNYLEETLYFANEIWYGREKVKNSIIKIIKSVSYIENNKKYYFDIDGIKYSRTFLYANFNCVGCDKNFNFCYNWHNARPFNCFLCKKCKKSIVHKCKDYRAKFEKSMIEKYGVRRPIQCEEIAAKFRNTMQQRYGVNYSGENPELLAKARSKLKFHGKSKIETQFTDLLKEKYGEDRIKCTGFEKFYFGDRWFYPDTIIDGNKIIEFFGDYWHGNPKLYDAEEIVAHDTTAKDLWEFDEKRIELMRLKGYKVFIVWEQDWLKNKKELLEELDKFINEKTTLLQRK